MQSLGMERNATKASPLTKQGGIRFGLLIYSLTLIIFRHRKLDIEDLARRPVIRSPDGLAQSFNHGRKCRNHLASLFSTLFDSIRHCAFASGLCLSILMRHGLEAASHIGDNLWFLHHARGTAQCRAAG